MNTSAGEVSRKDPMLRTLFVWTAHTIGTFLVWLVDVALVLWNPMRQASYVLLYLVLFYLLGFVRGIIEAVAARRYWIRIGERRQSLLSTDGQGNFKVQPTGRVEALQVPGSLHLGSNRWLEGFTGVCLVLAVVGLIYAFLITGFSDDVSIIGLLIGILCGVMFLFGLDGYFFVLRYQFQDIKVTEEGLRTRYLLKRRFIRWEDARIFATYEADGVKKSLNVKTYELTDGVTIVRWSQMPAIRLWVKYKHEGQGAQEWNDAIASLNALVMERTGLKLLYLGDSGQPQVAATPMSAAQAPLSEPTSSTEVQTVPAIVAFENDPVIKPLSLKGALGPTLLFFVLMIFAMIGVGIYALSSGARRNELGWAVSLLVGGVFSLIWLVALIVLLFYAFRIMRRLHQRQEEALRHPERFRAEVQPLAQTELPEVRRLIIRNNRWWMGGFIALITFMLWSVFGIYVFNFWWWITVISGLVFALLSAFFVLSLTRATAEQRIVVSPEGIMVRQAGHEHFVAWDDARLFFSHKGNRLSRSKTRDRRYALVSEYTIARWPRRLPGRWMYELEPNMSGPEYERWIEQINGYVVGRTGLALMDLE